MWAVLCNEQTIYIRFTASVLVPSLVLVIQIRVESNAVIGETLSIYRAVQQSNETKHSCESSWRLSDL